MTEGISNARMMSNDQCVAAIHTIVSRVGAYISKRMANQTLKMISGTATVRSAPFDSIAPIPSGVYRRNAECGVLAIINGRTF